MPLAFTSISHGVVPFGFYNIETDALLLDRLFFFSTDFCRAVLELGRRGEAEPVSVSLPGYRIDDPSSIGDLMGAIHGVRHTGYLGEVYRRWPFPADPEGFRQKVYGEANREVSEKILGRWGDPLAIPLAYAPSTQNFGIGPYLFSREGYRELLAYVWRGGYPTWDERPAYVLELSDLLKER